MNNLKATQSALDLIKSSEKYEPESYLCPAGKITIGYGHVILPDEKFTLLTEPEANALLLKDCAIAENCINKFVTIKLNQCQFDALVSLVFNIGVTRFKNSTILKKLNQGDIIGAANEFGRWIYVAGVILNGLVTRREKEKQLFLCENQ